jgi:hypothetical protein
MQSNALHVFCKGVVLGQDLRRGIPNDAGDGRGLRETLLLHQQ